MSEINAIHTSCKNCVFAKYNDLTQIDCELSYIEKYKNKNVSVIEAYDEEKEFYIINNKKCLGYRENKWFSQFNLEHSTLQEKINKFKELNFLQYLLMIDLKNFGGKDLENLKNQIYSCKIKPQKIVIIRYRNSIDDFKYENIKNLFDKDTFKGSWRIQTMVDESLSHEDILHNVTNINKGYRFMVDIKNPNNDLNDVVDKANQIVYEDLDQLEVVSNKDRSIILFSSVSYRWSLVVERKNILSSDDHYITV